MAPSAQNRARDADPLAAKTAHAILPLAAKVRYRMLALGGRSRTCVRKTFVFETCRVDFSDEGRRTFRNSCP